MSARFIRITGTMLLGLGLVSCDRQPTAPANRAISMGQPSFSAVALITEDKVPLGSFAAFIPCAAGGAGELAVAADPELHVILTTVIDDAGGAHFSGHFQPLRNWDGIGTITGDVYQATGVTRSEDTFGADGLPFESTVVNNFRWIGPGPGNNLLVHVTLHFTINANGVVTADVVNSIVDCK